MKYIADLHIHSHYSRATSRQLVPVQLAAWAMRKGVHIIASGDLSHPQWLDELGESLQPAAEAPGLYKLKDDLDLHAQSLVPGACKAPVYFILSGEISSIYKKNGQVRKIHNIVFMPSFSAAAKFQKSLERIGNIRSDGRPILGLDARDLLDIVLTTDADAHLIPAHIWTPWFSLLGSQSGFDSVEACFEELTPHIFALETGLSSDPPMNMRLSMLDRYNLVSNSDAHSPENLAREANIFDIPLSYGELFAALRDKNSHHFQGTIEFFPEEGKYHMDGHRKCNAMMRPPQTMQQEGLCPVCGKPATLGVSYRVEELADRPQGSRAPNAKPFHSLVPLPEIIAELYNMGVKSKRVQELYHKLLQEGGSELSILMTRTTAELERLAGPPFAEAIRRMRAGEVIAQPGFDGEYGVIRLFRPEERAQWLQQSSLFAMTAAPRPQAKPASPPIKTRREKPARAAETPPAPYGLNPEQAAAVSHTGAPLIIQAGPGTGKTRTLTARLAHLIHSGVLPPRQIVAITFTNKAAQEMRERLTILLGADTVASMTIQTFHAFGCELLRQAGSFEGRKKDFVIIDAENDTAFIREVKHRSGEAFTAQDLKHIEALKRRLCVARIVPEDLWETLPSSLRKLFHNYEEILTEWNAVDFNDLIALAVHLLRFDADLRRRLQQQFRAIFVDEFQDIDAAQYELFRIFALSAAEVCVIGDPDQAIYGFRGASREFFQRFHDDFPGARAIRLQRNYRSPQALLSAAHEIIRHGAEATAPRLVAERKEEVKVHLHAARSDRSEADDIVAKIDELVGGASHLSMDMGAHAASSAARFAFSDMAILIRTRWLLPPIEQALARAGIPFRALCERPLIDEEALAATVAALQIWQRRKPLALPVRTLLNQQALENEELFHYLCRLIQREAPGEHPPQGVDAAQQERFDPLIRLFTELLTWPADWSLVTVLENIYHYLPLRRPEAEKESRRQLLRKASAFSGSTEAFIDLLALQKQVDDYDPRAQYVPILTLHAAKGLEFPVVFIPGCEEGMLPFSLSDDLEEERRLFYVGMTRAGQELYLSHARTRLLRRQLKNQTPSRYLAEIPERLLRKQQGSGKKGKRNDQLKLF